MGIFLSYNDLKMLLISGNIKVFCRLRPLFDDVGLFAVEFPCDLTIHVDTGDETSTNPKKDYEFDRVYGPHVGQADIFNDVQPLVQLSLDGFNVSIFAYGQSNLGKTHTMANDARKDLYDKEKELQDVKQEVLGLKQALKDANDQCVLLFNEVQKAWKVSYTLQSDLKGNAMVTNMVMVTVKAMIMITGIVEMVMTMEAMTIMTRIMLDLTQNPKSQLMHITTIIIKNFWNIIMSMIIIMAMKQILQSHWSRLAGAYLHVLGDSIQSVGVMIGGAIIWYKPEWKIIDLICTLIFSVIVLGTTIRMLRNILEVLMESTPREIDATRLSQGLCEMDDVTAVHELHIWAITVGKVLLACHVKIKHEANADRVLNKVVDFIRREYNISHVTIQIERE
ncbi:hypothetical protein EUGRSUZ_D01644 [Eucalyptus grandis]|uniref:Kinesin motor domain-containing protein n=2 Tax=Eucalyptus grandis TaxID=71139 RepID=A0A059CH77_EUCGR|nr:hypothetical protein EUGRSUZ_D01644 [Eucalyptus grandis]